MPPGTQEAIYDDLIKPMIDKFMDGFNSTVLVYGQTGTGKTYTMGLESEASNICCCQLLIAQSRVRACSHERWHYGNYDVVCKIYLLLFFSFTTGKRWSEQRYDTARFSRHFLFVPKSNAGKRRLFYDYFSFVYRNTYRKSAWFAFKSSWGSSIYERWFFYIIFK